MNYRKTAILLTVAIVLVGGGVIALIAYRSKALQDQPIPPPVTGGNGQTAPPGDGNGGLEPPPGSGTPTNGEPAPSDDGVVQTTVSEEEEPYVCDVSDDQLDCDYDGLLNGEEREAGTDPLDEDSDGDGYSDAVEVQAHGTDPNDPNSKGSPYRRETPQNP